jgi:hypothetical protein
MYVNEKMIPVETIPEWGGCKGEWYIWYSVKTFVNATMYSHPEKIKNKKIKIHFMHFICQVLVL